MKTRLTTAIMAVWLAAATLGLSACGGAAGDKDAETVGPMTADTQGAPLAAASPSRQASPATGKLIARFGWTSDPSNLNPFIGYESSDYEVWRLNYNLLTGWDAATLAPAPELATSWDISDDGKTWTFHLRDDVKWHDGKPLTADDVAFTFMYIIDNEMGNFTMYTEFIDSVEAVDPVTVRFNCSQPKANMLGMWVPILPKHIWEKVDPASAARDYVNEPPIVGSGPFQVIEYKKSAYVRLKAVDDYWGGDPMIDEVILQTYQNADTMAQDMRSGSLDAAWGVPDAQVEALDALPDIVAWAYVPTGLDELGINCYDSDDSLGHPVLRDPAFRRALNYAVDKEKIKQIAYTGMGITGLSIVQPDKYSEPDWHWAPPHPYEFDIERAKAELDAAGYKDTDGDGWREYRGKPITLRLYSRSESASSQSSGKLIAGWFKQAGINIKLEVIDDGALADKQFNYKGDTFAPDFDLFLWGWGGDIDPNFILSVFTTAQIESWSDCNWSNEEYDRLFKEQQRTIDPDERKKLIDRMQEIFYDESPYIVLMYPANTMAYNERKWEGWVRSPSEDGAVWYTATHLDTYMQLRPAAAKEATGDGGGGLGGGAIGGIVAGVIVVVGAATWLLLRSRRRRQVDEF